MSYITTVLQVTAPDGAKFYTDVIDLRRAATATHKYIADNCLKHIAHKTVFTLMDLTEEQRKSDCESQESINFFKAAVTDEMPTVQ